MPEPLTAEQLAVIDEAAAAAENLRGGQWFPGVAYADVTGWIAGVYTHQTFGRLNTEESLFSCVDCGVDAKSEEVTASYIAEASPAVIRSLVSEVLALREQVARSRSERAAAARVREAHSDWLDVSQMGSISFGMLLGIRACVDGISTGLESFAAEIEGGE